ncbi:MAG: crossover junction endodeoxyribonuclease RuvC [Phycisphaerales bacterium]|nr:crossover junction endodeoxyribonuclease RuvC [Phycisphaerales bacterium]
MRILGIDPGLRLTGYACVDGLGDRPALVEAGVLRLTLRDGRATTATEPDGPAAAAPGRAGSTSARSVSDRLAELDTDFRELLARLRPDTVAIESLFAHYKHPATAIVMGHARGILLLAVRRANLRLIEYKPNEIKKSLTGHGHAAKDQMQRAVQAHFGLAEPPRPPDVADAIAIALCASRRLSFRDEVIDPFAGSATPR